jgi:hypothetical protein
MNTAPAVQRYLIDGPFERVLKMIRAALQSAELSVVAELELSNVLPGIATLRGRVILVDCPLLTFEAMALNRGAAVFIPVHVVVSGNGVQSQALIVSPDALLDLRLPAGAGYPVDRLHSRVAMALESVAEDSVC